MSNPQESGFWPVRCDHCEKLIGYGRGDINCILWVCPDCDDYTEAVLDNARAQQQARNTACRQHRLDDAARRRWIEALKAEGLDETAIDERAGIVRYKDENLVCIDLSNAKPVPPEFYEEGSQTKENAG